MDDYCIISSKLNHLISGGQLTENTIVKVKKYVKTDARNIDNANDKRIIMLIMQLEVLTSGSEIGQRICEPMNLSKIDVQKDASNEPAEALQRQNSIENEALQSSLNPMVPAPKRFRRMDFIKIGDLDENYGTIDWKTKARVIAKSSIRNWSNAKGDGKLFFMDLMDRTGQIRATAFNDLVDKFYNTIEVCFVCIFTLNQIV